MRILQVCPHVYGDVGGVSVHVKNISEHLAKNHDVTVYVSNPDSRCPRFEVKNGVKIERFRCFAPSNSYFLSWDMLLRLKKIDFDIVHGHSYHAFPMHFARIAKCRKFVVTPHFHGVGHSPFRRCLVRLLKPFGKRTFDLADRIIAVSQFEKRLLCKEFNIDSDKVIVIPNGVNFSEFKGLRKRNHNFKLMLYVGFLDYYKGVHYLVEVLPKLPDDVVLDIVGDGPLKAFLRGRAAELGVGRRVRFYQNLPRRELLQKYVDADVFVLLSMYEAYSLVIAEALAAGTPCVVAEASALSEWVDNESCFGVTLPPNLKKLADLISYVLYKDVDKEVMRKWIGTKILDWRDVSQMLEKIYAQ